MKISTAVACGWLAALAAAGAFGADDPPVPPAAAASPAKAKPASASKSAARKSPATAPAQDRLELDPSAITGSKELPKVLVIVPWKKADLGDLAGKPLNSLVDDALQPIDRDVFRREVDYHTALAKAPARTGAVEAGAVEATPNR